MTHLSEQELSFFNSLFEAEQSIDDPINTKMSLNLNLPDKLSGLLKNAKLTLLAEVGIYQLWFPLEFTTDERGQLTPVLSAPEVIDTKGVERSWRTPDLDLQTEKYVILSLSSTGLLLQPKHAEAVLEQEITLAFNLPNQEHVMIRAKPVRATSKGIAAKIIKVCEGQDAMRQYLFDIHKHHHAKLYEQGNITTELI
ncbi:MULTISPECIES: hypothetical protein [Pseudoalteromonas]|uniref:hypothetical protein n=1 Tax=Pseudoalteromonas TaxID=53246 RepID=UPI0007851E20|nr:MULTISPECIES: hypothetical protein [Gammaproteobacteria]MCF7519358.1 hypothetical protein [Pseudoalteromonas sp. L21]UJX26882.1 hypothetical protein L3Q70_07065 [Pseudoalteromonas sp. CF6-2]|tara:strand:+ start:1014 stop:1604 length:591 start_codon:yes stop_codon:yes gene_type:complete